METKKPIKDASSDPEPEDLTEVGLISSPRKKQIAIAEQIYQTPARESDSVGYIPNLLVTTTLPAKDIHKQSYARQEGRQRMTVSSAHENGVPFGAKARLIIAWMTKRSVVAGSAELYLGNTLTDFVRTLRLVPSGHARGTKATVLEQLHRLSKTTFNFEQQIGKNVVKFENILVADSGQLLISSLESDSVANWTPVITLSDKFFKLVTASPVAFDQRVLVALSGSPKMMDLYWWLTHKNYSNRHPLELKWDFWANLLSPEVDRDNTVAMARFKYDFKIMLSTVLTYYPEAKVSFEGRNKCPVVYPSPPHIPKLMKIDTK